MKLENNNSSQIQLYSEIGEQTESRLCHYFEEYKIVVNQSEFGPFKHRCALPEGHPDFDHRCSFGKVIGKHDPEYGDRMGVGVFQNMDELCDLSIR